MNDEAQLFFDINTDDEVKATRVIAFPKVAAPVDLATEYDDLEAEPIGDTVCSSIALQRINKRLGEFSRYQLYRVIRGGNIKAFKPGAKSRSDGKRSAADLKICEESLERFIARKEIEMQYGI